MNRPRGRLLILFVSLLFVAGLYTAGKKAWAHTQTDSANCGWTQVGDTTPVAPNANGTGYVYRTFRVTMTGTPVSTVGGIVSADCNVVNYWDISGGRVYAVQAELGRKLDSHVGGSLAAPGICVPEPPDYPPALECMPGSGDAPIYQDDAAIVTINGTTVSCVGIWPCGNIYDNGVEPEPGAHRSTSSNTSVTSWNARRGAGFIDVPRQTLSGNGTDVIEGLPVSLMGANTWSGNYEVSVLITLKYQRNNGQCSPSTQTVGVSQPASLTASGTGTFTWSAPGGSPSSGSGTSFSTSYSTAGNKTVTMSTGGVTVNCTVIVTSPSAECPSYSPYGSFSPMQRDVPLSAGGAPNASGSSEWVHAGPSTGSWSTGSWSLASSSTTSQTEERFRTRTTTTTERRYYYYYPYVYNTDGTLRTRVMSVQGTTHWADETTPYTGGTNGTVRLDYTTHYNNYPYDQHQPIVTYQVRYDQRRVTQERTITTTETQRDTRTRTRTSSTATWGSWSSNPWSAYDSDTNTSDWSNVSGTDTSNGGQTWTGNRTVDAPFMPPCFPRRYSMSATANTAGLDDREMPTTASFSGSITATFSVDNHGVDPMRQASRINNMGYTVTYRIRRANGTMTGATTVAPTPGSPQNFVASNSNRFSSSSATVTANIGVSVPAPLQVGDSVCWRLSLTGPTQGQVGISGAALSGASGTAATPEVCSPTVVNWPYLKVLGNDVVGGGVVGGCSSGGIRTHFRSGPGNARGSSAQHAAFAGQAIQGFMSAALTNAAGATGNGFVPGPLRGLSFGNSTANYGGNYAANDGTPCMPNYFASRPTSTEDLTSGNLNSEIHTPNSDPDRLEFYYVNSGATLNAVNVGNRTRKVFFVDGTLTLNGNVTMNGTWNNRDDIPYVTFIARNITINGGVSNIDGFYVAEDTIRTCNMNSFANCRTPLTVNGALSAANVRFLRTRGSHRDSKELEGRSTTLTVPNTCSDGTISTAISDATGITGRSCAAEIINFAPELYLALSSLGSPPEDIRYDSFIVLPPNL